MKSIPNGPLRGQKMMWLKRKRARDIRKAGTQSLGLKLVGSGMRSRRDNESDMGRRTDLIRYS
jgi:hypothetical protein